MKSLKKLDDINPARVYDLLEPSEPDTETEVVTIAVGIDLGTTNSLVAIVQNSVAHIIPDPATGLRILPSVVHYSHNQVTVGTKAWQKQGYISSAKRLMGRSSEDIPNLSSFVPYPLCVGQDNGPIMIKTEAGNKTPIEVAAEILKVLKNQAEAYLGQAVKHAVITVPAYFGESARVATKYAAKMAGLEVLRILNEPTAAAVAYGLEQKAEGSYLVFDLGGGTFDVSIIRLTRGVFHVMSTAGDVFLGGDDFDYKITEHMRHNFNAEGSLADLLQQARQIKEALTTTKEWVGQFGTKAGCKLSRIQFEQMLEPYAKYMHKIVRKALVDAELTISDIDEVLMVGGATRIPYIRNMVEKWFAKPPLTSINPEEVVVTGAALQAQSLTYGSDTTLLDITPLSLGIELNGGIVEVLIPRNTPIPTECTKFYTTARDGQSAFIIHVLQGESSEVKDCMSLAQFELRNLPSMPAGQVKLGISFRIDADGLLTVDAVETTTGNKHEVIIKPSYNLDSDTIKSLTP